jgi:hypothetical protein
MKARWKFFTFHLYGCGTGLAPITFIRSARRNCLFPEVNLSASSSEEFLTLSENDQELHRFFDRVRAAGKIVVRVGDHEFVVEHRPSTITDEARRMLARGGPED